MRTAVNMDITVIIVNWNTGKLLTECLQAITAEISDLNFEIIVIDNHSSDDSVQNSKLKFPGLVYIENPDNRGFARANNQGLDMANGKYILFLNPDTRVQTGSIHRLMEYLQNNPKVGIVGGKLIYPNGIPQPSYYDFPSLKSFANLVSLLYLHPGYQRRVGDESEYEWAKFIEGRGWISYPETTVQDIPPEAGEDQPREIDYPVGACFLARKEMIASIGKFDERYFLYCEETDWCYRASQAGWKIYTVPKALIIHYGGASTVKAREKRMMMWQTSQLQYFKKHFGWWESWKLKFLFKHFPRVFLEAMDSISQGETGSNPSTGSGELSK